MKLNRLVKQICKYVHIRLRFLTLSALLTDSMTLIKTVKFHSCYTYLSQLYGVWLWFFLLFLISTPKSEIQGWEHSLTRQEGSQLECINIYDIFTNFENTDCILVGVSPQWDPIWSLSVHQSTVAEYRLPVTTLLRLLLPGVLIRATKIRAKPQQITAVVASHSVWI